MLGTMKMFCIRMNILSHRNNIVLFLACNMAAVQNLTFMYCTDLSISIFVVNQLKPLLHFDFR